MFGLYGLLSYFHLQMAPMHVQNAREVPEYEINSNELDFSGSVDITKVLTKISFSVVT